MLNMNVCIHCAVRSLRCILDDYTPDVVESLETTFTVGFTKHSYFIHVSLQYSNFTVIILHHRWTGVARQLSLIRKKLENLSQGPTGVFAQNYCICLESASHALNMYYISVLLCLWYPPDFHSSYCRLTHDYPFSCRPKTLLLLPSSSWNFKVAARFVTTIHPSIRLL